MFLSHEVLLACGHASGHAPAVNLHQTLHGTLALAHSTSFCELCGVVGDWTSKATAYIKQRQDSWCQVTSRAGAHQQVDSVRPGADVVVSMCACLWVRRSAQQLESSVDQ